MMWLQNLDNAGSEEGTPVGPVGAGKQLMLLFVGRCWWAALIISEALRRLGVS